MCLFYNEKWYIIALFLTYDKLEHRHACTPAPYYGGSCANVISALITNCSMNFKNIHRKAMAKCIFCLFISTLFSLIVVLNIYWNNSYIWNSNSPRLSISPVFLYFTNTMLHTSGIFLSFFILFLCCPFFSFFLYSPSGVRVRLSWIFRPCPRTPRIQHYSRILDATLGCVWTTGFRVVAVWISHFQTLKLYI